MQIGDIEGGDKAPDVVEAMADCFGYESMLGLKQKSGLLIDSAYTTRVPCDGHFPKSNHCSGPRGDRVYYNCIS